MPEQATAAPAATERETHTPQGALAGLALSALGVVFGDIGTSPLYTLKTVLEATGAHPSMVAILGSLSLIVWTLIIVTSVKYVLLAMRIDNDGEGGILALMSLLGIKRQQRRIIVLVGLFGAALIYGDGAITPSISVLSALEGLNMVIPHFERFVVPLAVIVLFALFALQSRGTARIGRLFGPFMALWFVTIGLLGIYGIALHPAVVVALNPRYGLAYLISGGPAAFAVLGGVFLCVTGAEALYADMGHFGARPIRAAWYGLVLPSLVLSYAGQDALVLSGAPVGDNIFYSLCPPALLILLIILATAATIIASQSIITGAFSMTRQAMLLGWMPRLAITQTSSEGYGQIYVGAVNWLLMLVTLGLTIGFGKSDNLAAAYGIAVSMTMLMTTVLLFIAMREIWGWNIAAAGLAAGCLFVIDAAFVSANMLKVAEGGYVPLALAVLVYAVMLTWHRGVAALNTRVSDNALPLEQLTPCILQYAVARVPGTAVVLTQNASGTPPVLLWYLKHSRALQEKLLILTVRTELVPFVPASQRLSITSIAENLWHASARFGFMDRQDIPALLDQARSQGCTLDLAHVTYFVGRVSVIRAPENSALPRWIAAPFAFLQRNSAHATDYFHLPTEDVVEIGREVAL
jgi:KUP system potassium uptake protein